jgi:hypothetical protein
VSTYENAPATKLLATHCACCSRVLLDAVSVETGVGPTCRKAHGYKEAQTAPDWTTVIQRSDGLVAVAELFPFGSPEASAAAYALGGLETRRVANLVVHRIAAEQSGPAVLQLVGVLRALGFARMADRIEERLVSVRIELDREEYVVHSPYSPEAADRFKALPRQGRRWEPEAKVWRVSTHYRTALFGILKASFPGAAAVGPKGAFTL